MKKAIWLPLLLAAAPVWADENSGPYIGAKYGQFYVDIEEVNEPTDGGFLLGYRFGSGAAIEFEHTEAQADIILDHTIIGGIDLETNALYFAYRTPGTAYFKVKAGLLREKVTGEASGADCYFDGYAYYCFSYDTVIEEKDDTGLSIGLGGGVNIGSVAQLELEYTIIEQDVSFLSLGLNLRF